MSYRVNPKEFEAVLALPDEARFSYFVGKVTDFGQIWSVWDESGWALLADDSGSEFVPVWPAEAFAAAHCTADWAERRPRKIDLSDWMDKWIPGLRRDGRKIAVFPAPRGKGAVVDPEAALREALAAYGEDEEAE